MCDTKMTDHDSYIEPELNKQYVYKEILCDPSDLDCMSFCTEDTDHVIEEALVVARQLLYKRILEIADTFMTIHQKQVFVLMLKERTYHEIATILSDNYSSAYSGYTAISHAIKGQLNKGRGNYHGGLEKKLRKLCNKDTYCIDLLQWIKQMMYDTDVALEFLYKFDPTFTKQIAESLQADA